VLPLNNLSSRGHWRHRGGFPGARQDRALPEDPTKEGFGTETATTVGLKRLRPAPARCSTYRAAPRSTRSLLGRLRGASALLFDGRCYTTTRRSTWACWTRRACAWGMCRVTGEGSSLHAFDGADISGKPSFISYHQPYARIGSEAGRQCSGRWEVSQTGMNLSV